MLKLVIKFIQSKLVRLVGDRNTKFLYQDFLVFYLQRENDLWKSCIARSKCLFPSTYNGFGNVLQLLLQIIRLLKHFPNFFFTEDPPKDRDWIE